MWKMTRIHDTAKLMCPIVGRVENDYEIGHGDFTVEIRNDGHQRWTVKM